MDNGKIIKNYSVALFANAVMQGKEEKIFQQIQSIEQSINSNPKLAAIMVSPIVPKLNKSAIIQLLVENLRLEEIIKRFLLLLVKNSRLSILKDIVPFYQKLLDQSKNIKAVEVISAKILALKEQQQLKEYLESDFGQPIKIKFANDQSIIGGMVIKYDSKLLDCSIAGALSKIEKIFKNTKIFTLEVT